MLFRIFSRHSGELHTFLHGCMQDAGHVYVHMVPAFVDRGDISMSMLSGKPRVKAWDAHADQSRTQPINQMMRYRLHVSPLAYVHTQAQLSDHRGSTAALRQATPQDNFRKPVGECCNSPCRPAFSLSQAEVATKFDYKYERSKISHGWSWLSSGSLAPAPRKRRPRVVRYAIGMSSDLGQSTYAHGPSLRELDLSSCRLQDACLQAPHPSLRQTLQSLFRPNCW